MIWRGSFGEAHQFIAVNAALTLKAFLYTNIHLRVQPIPAGVNGRADDRRKRRLDEQLPTYDYKDSLSSRIA
jgi:hypothetical protein